MSRVRETLKAQRDMNGSLDIVVHRDRYGSISTVVATTEDGTVVSLFSTPEEDDDSSYDRCPDREKSRFRFWSGPRMRILRLRSPNRGRGYSSINRHPT